MKYDILHRTRYVYNTPVRDSFNDVRLEPLTNSAQTVEAFQLRVLPSVRVDRYADFYSNWVHHFEIPEPHLFLVVESQSRVESHPVSLLPENAQLCPLNQMDRVHRSERCHDFLQSSRYVEIDVEPWRLAIDATTGQTDAWQCALALMRFAHGYLKYEPHSTHVHSHVSDVMAKRTGVCQDFAHLMIGLCRSVKIPARYVSGYLATETASATHAWTEVCIPEVGWRALDPTHNCQAGESYIKLAVGRDYADVPPVAGSYRGTLSRKMEVEVKITPLPMPGPEPIAK